MDLELGSYSTDRGLRLRWVPGFMLSTSATPGEITLSGNAEGLRSLAQHLLTLAGDDVPSGTHAHFEPGLELESDSTALIIDKM